MKKGESIIVEQLFNKPAEIVWAALTEVDKMRKWFFENIPDFKAEAGFKTQFNVQSESRNFLHKWEITEVIPNEQIKYNWRYEDYPGDSELTIELDAMGKEQTKLILTHKVLEDFDDNIPEFKAESCHDGWEYFIRKSLVEYLDIKQ